MQAVAPFEAQGQSSGEVYTNNYLPMQPSVETPENGVVSEEQLADQAAVKVWQGRITKAKQKWAPDFKRMKDNMEFVTGLQWPGQIDLQDDRYQCNLTLRLVNQKVATLYARNPTAEVTRRKQLDYQIWDGQIQSLMPAMQQASMLVSSGGILPPDLEMLLQDVQAGKQRNRLVQNVCETIDIIYQYFIDAQKPDFKEQAKQMVRSTIICSVGYVKPVYCSTVNATYHNVFSTDISSTKEARVQRAKEIMMAREEQNLDPDSAEMATLKSLVMSIGASESLQDEDKLPERLEFDFPMATSIIVDPRCRNLKEFVAARWIAQEYILPVSEVNALFDTDITVGGGEGYATEHNMNGSLLLDEPNRDSSKESDPFQKNLVSLYEIFDYNSKTRCFIVQGWKDYVVAPEPVFPSVSGFWPIQSLVFNDTVVDPDTRASIYPPSDVDLSRSAQKEWNRTRDALRNQRNANAPKYIVRKGYLTDEDIAKLKNAEPNSVIQLEGIPPDVEPSKFIQVMQVAAIDQLVYDTAPLEQDLMLSGGAQQANIGPAQPNVTATVGTIAEQSRMTVASSNIDDLDGVLSRLAQAGGEMLLRALPSEMATRIAGPGAAWPENTREDFVNEIQISIRAASSGRPNKAVELANFQQIAPLLLQSGANPFAVIKEGVRRLDDALDVSDFLPTMMPMQPQNGQEAPQNGGQQPQPAQGQPSPNSGGMELPSQPATAAGGQSVPMAGAPHLNQP